MKNLIKKVLAGALALAALSVSLSKTAQAQTSSPWKVTIGASAGAPAYGPSYDFPAATPLNSSYVYANPPAGLDGLVYRGGRADVGYVGPYAGNVDLFGTLVWDGNISDCPDTVDVEETIVASAFVSPKKGRTASYGNAITYSANVSGLPTGVTATTTTDTFSKIVSATFTRTYTVNKSGAVPTVVLPSRHAESDLVVDYSLEPSIPSSQYATTYGTSTNLLVVVK